MSQYTEAQDELLDLADRLAADELEATGFDRLDELVSGDLELRRLYIERMRMVADLRCASDDFLAECEAALGGAGEIENREALDQVAEKVTLSPRRETEAAWKRFARRSPMSASFSVASVIFVVVLSTLAIIPVGRIKVADPKIKEPAPTKKQQQHVARLVGTIDCEWAGKARIKAGRNLLPGDKLTLKRGIAEFRFGAGADVALKGPAEIEVQSAKRCVLDRGSLTARVEPGEGKGFAVVTPTSVVTDFGTEFGVLVGVGGSTVVEVFDGETVLQARQADGSLSEGRKMARGDCLAVNTSRVISASESIAGDMVRIDQVRAMTEPRVELLGLYTFDGHANDASSNKNHATSISNVEYVDGFEGKAAKFAGDVQSYIDLPIDVSVQTEPVITWGAWVRPAALGEVNREILSTDNGGFDRVLTLDLRDGEQLFDSHRFACFRGDGVLRSGAYGPNLGYWTFVAAIYDQKLRTVELFVEDHRRKMVMKDVGEQTTIKESHRFIRVGMHAGDANEPFAGEIDNAFVLRGACNTRQLEQIRGEGVAGALAVARVSALIDKKRAVARATETVPSTTSDLRSTE